MVAADRANSSSSLPFSTAKSPPIKAYLGAIAWVLSARRYSRDMTEIHLPPRLPGGEAVARTKLLTSQPPGLPRVEAATSQGKVAARWAGINWADLLSQLELNVHQLDRSARLSFLVTYLCKAWQASRVSMVLPHSSTQIAPLRVAAVSNQLTPELSLQQQLTLEQAGFEAIQQQTTVWSLRTGAEQFPCPWLAMAQSQLAGKIQGFVVTLPVGHGDQISAACVIEFDGARSKPFERAPQEGVAELNQTILPLGAVVAMLNRRDHFLTRCWSRLKNSRHAGLFCAAASVMLLAAAFVPVSVPLSASARVEGQVQHQVHTPVAGILKSVLASPGDVLQHGQVIAELREQDLELEKTRLTNEVLIQEAQYRSAMAKGDRSAMMQSQAKGEELRAQLELIGQQLDGIQLKSPIKGVLISADLKAQIGNPVERGQLLAVVAPENRYRVIVELDEFDLPQVQIGQAAELVLSSRPGQSLALVIDRIAPVATTLEQRSVVELTAYLSGKEQTDFGLKPGQRGVVHLQTPKRSLARVLYERYRPRLQLWALRWLPML